MKQLEKPAITPGKTIKSFLLDLEIFPGNSGGPVYFFDEKRRYGGKWHDTEWINFIAGLVSQEKYAVVDKKVTPIEVSRTRTKIEIEEIRETLGLAVVVPACFIKETIEQLQEKSKNEAGPNKPNGE